MAKSILVVDGEPSVRESVAEALVLEGYRATIAAGGADALAEVDRVRPDLIVLDLGSAEKPGLELCRTLRAASSVPILLLGANGGDVDRDAGLRAGADDLVRRPFRVRELPVRVGMLLRRTEAAVSAGLDAGVVDLGRVRADLAGRRLLQGDRVVPVRPRAFALLAFFIRHPGQVFSRQELLERVWGEDAGTGTRTVDVHVHWLRQRIEEDAAHPALLQTVRGIGYVFRRPG